MKTTKLCNFRSETSVSHQRGLMERVIASNKSTIGIDRVVRAKEAETCEYILRQAGLGWENDRKNKSGLSQDAAH